MSEHKIVASCGDSRPRLSVERSSTFFFRHDLQLSHYLIPLRFDFHNSRRLDFSLHYFPFFEMSFGLRVFAPWQRQGSGCNSRAAAQL